mgnify:FL=1|nr:MAG TPA: hypothetical protein [Myoviridae sp. ctfuG5]
MTLFQDFMIAVVIYLLIIKVLCVCVHQFKGAAARYAYHYVFSLIIGFILLSVGFVWAVLNSFYHLGLVVIS